MECRPIDHLVRGFGIAKQMRVPWRTDNTRHSFEQRLGSIVSRMIVLPSESAALFDRLCAVLAMSQCCETASERSLAVSLAASPHLQSISTPSNGVAAAVQQISTDSRPFLPSPRPCLRESRRHLRLISLSQSADASARAAESPHLHSGRFSRRCKAFTSGSTTWLDDGLYE